MFEQREGTEIYLYKQWRKKLKRSRYSLFYYHNISAIFIHILVFGCHFWGGEKVIGTFIGIALNL